MVEVVGMVAVEEVGMVEVVEEMEVVEMVEVVGRLRTIPGSTFLQPHQRRRPRHTDPYWLPSCR